MLSEKIPEWIRAEALESEDPVYVYDKNKIIETCNSFKSITYPNTSIHFATMANCSPAFLEIIKDEGLNVFVNSTLHLNEVKKAGFRDKEIIFTASSINREMMHRIDEENMYANLDSLSQLDYWEKNFPGKPVGIRCNIENKAYSPKSSRAGSFIGENSRLGLNIEEIKSIKNKELINGLHIYIGTDIIDVDYFLSYYEILIDLAKDFPNIEYVDFGGGFGIDEKGEESFDFETYSKKVTQLMTDFSEIRGKLIKLILEPGRILGGQSGYFICRATDIKFRNDIQFIGVNASSTQFPRPLLYPNESFHPVWLLDENGLLKNENQIKTKINGCSTYSRDFLSHDALLPNAKEGDFVIFGNAGAYCASMHSSFLGFEKPKEIFI
jgi:diaminopimelate decarboxylase